MRRRSWRTTSPKGVVAEVHLYHPQPYHDPRQAHRRLVTPRFLADVHRGLTPGGLFVVQTDNPDYWAYMTKVLPVFFAFEEQSGPWPDAPDGRSRREILARSRGLAIFRGVGQARADLDRRRGTRPGQVPAAAGLPEPRAVVRPRRDRRPGRLTAAVRGAGPVSNHATLCVISFGRAVPGVVSSKGRSGGYAGITARSRGPPSRCRADAPEAVRVPGRTDAANDVVKTSPISAPRPSHDTGATPHAFEASSRACGRASTGWTIAACSRRPRRASRRSSW